MKAKWFVLLLLPGLLLAAGCKKPAPRSAAGSGAAPAPIPSAEAGKPANQRTVEIYVPCGLILPLREAIAAFEKAHPDVDVRGTFDNAITLARRIKDKGERPDLFISPGDQEMKILEQANLVDPQSKRRFGRFELTVMVPKANPAGIAKVEDLAKAKTISCPDPKNNSVGAYAEQALTKLGLWDKLKPKMVLTEFAIESHTMVANGKAQAGLAFKHCPLDTAPEKLSKSKVSIACDFPLASYPVVTCEIATLKDAKNPTDANAFAEYLASPAGQQVMVAQGLPALEAAPAAGTPAGSPAPPASGAAAAKVKVQAFYPDNEGHAGVKQLVLGFNQKYPGKVNAEFIDFTSDAGFDRWQAAGMTCGGILINNQQTVTLKQGAKSEEVTFIRAVGGEWTKEQLQAAVAQAVAQAYP